MKPSCVLSGSQNETAFQYILKQRKVLKPLSFTHNSCKADPRSRFSYFSSPMIQRESTHFLKEHRKERTIARICAVMRRTHYFLSDIFPSLLPIFSLESLEAAAENSCSQFTEVKQAKSDPKVRFEVFLLASTQV